MCEKCKNYEEKTSVSIPPKGTPIRRKSFVQIYFSNGTIWNNCLEVTQDEKCHGNKTVLTFDDFEVVEITPVKTAPPKGTIVEVWNTNTKPSIPNIRRSFGKLNLKNELNVFVDGNNDLSGNSWIHWEVVKQ